MQQDVMEIKYWLKKNRLKYAWLAKKCFVSEGSVKNWFSRGIIPPAKIALIQQLMSKTVTRDACNPTGLPETELKNKLFVTLDPEKQEALEIQAHMNGMSLSSYCTLILERAADHEYEFLNDILAMFEQKWQNSARKIITK